ncbi:MAG: ribonuclease HIII [archaeon]|nr:ribonuclease HIII [archaeon]
MEHTIISLTGFDNKKITKLLEGEFKETPITNLYESRRLKNEDVLIVIYTSGKAVIQGKEKYAEFIADFIGGKKKKNDATGKKDTTGTLIGSDESLKGDTFGGIVVASVKADDEKREKLKDIGVRDSKEISDSEIIKLAEKIKEILGKDSYCVYEKMPEAYNQHIGSTTTLLNSMHTTAIKTLGDTDLIIVDQYPGTRINLKNAKTETKAESKYIEVAAASILARERSLDQLKRLSEDAGFRLPKGSTHVKDALKKLKKEGLDPKKYVKLHFRNVKKYF